MRSSRHHNPDQTAPGPRVDTLVRQARRWRRRGQFRRAMLALHEACALRQNDAALWTRYAADCVRARKRDDALRALGHALWLRQRARDRRRARVTEALRDSLICRGSWTLPAWC